LASYQKKLFAIDDHIGVAIAGLTSDARVLRYPRFHLFSPSDIFSKYMQAMALGSRMNMNRPIPIQRLVADISDSTLDYMMFATLTI
jgi:20S proteasome subunit alpha 6